LLADALITFFNLVIKEFGLLIDILMNLLPNSPFKFILDSSVSEFLPYVNWILPIPEALAIGQTWLTAITTFYLIQIALRWVKAIE